jgi:hypothetical protein
MQTRMNAVPTLTMKSMPYRPGDGRPIRVMLGVRPVSRTKQNISRARYMNDKESNVREGMAP